MLQLIDSGACVRPFKQTAAAKLRTDVTFMSRCILGSLCFGDLWATRQFSAIWEA